MANKTPKTKTLSKTAPLIYLRTMERRDIPKIISWIISNDFEQLSDYPRNNLKALKDQVLRELSLPKFIYAQTQLLVAEVSGQLLVGFIRLSKIDWQNRHCNCSIFIPTEYKNKTIISTIENYIHRFIFNELQLHKAYRFFTSLNQTEIEQLKRSKVEPEAILAEYITGPKNEKIDLYVYADYKASGNFIISSGKDAG